MNDKEKLISLLILTDPNPYTCESESGSCELTTCTECRARSTADLLIANGVTVQEWISVDDKLPPYNRDVLVYRPNMAMKFLVDNYEGYYGEDDDEWYEGWALYGGDTHGNPVITHWAYLPQPPKGE